MKPDTGDMSIACAGFNGRNLGPRSTPCDQDYLRKLAKQTAPEKLEQWYNHHVAKLYGELDAYDEEGLFIGDGSYLFVPDNKNYEGSMRLLFDEHNHPVSKSEEKKTDQGPARSLPVAALLSGRLSSALRSIWRTVRGGWRATAASQPIGSSRPVETGGHVCPDGWTERDLSIAPIPGEISRLREARVHTCLRSPSPRGVFRADLPPGEYDAELIFAVRGAGTNPSAST